MAIEASIFSFFAGAGILDLAFETNGFDIVFTNELNTEFMKGYRYAREQLRLEAPIYGYRHNSAEKYSSGRGKRQLIKMMEAERKKGKLVGFIGGPPCPDFSVGGKNAGENGENGRLTRVYFDIICRCKPDFFLFENVKGLTSTEKHRKFYNEMKRKVQGNHYITSDKLLNALEYGVPQFRERVIMIGLSEVLSGNKNVKDGETNDLVFNWSQNKNFEMDALMGMEWPTTDHFTENCVRPFSYNIPESLTVQYWFDKNHVTEHPNGKEVFCVRNGWPKFYSIGEGDTKGKSYKRLHRWRYSPTAAYGHNEVHLHPYQARRISVAEAMAIQSLPETFVLPHKLSLTCKYKMIGNGVPFLMASAISRTLMDLLEHIEEEE